MRARTLGVAGAAALAVVAVGDLIQKRHALLRNIPVIGHARLMSALGCVESHTCHIDMCPADVATLNPSLACGLAPRSKTTRAAVYPRTLRKELSRISAQLALIPATDVEIMNGDHEARPLPSRTPPGCRVV